MGLAVIAKKDPESLQAAGHFPHSQQMFSPLDVALQKGLDSFRVFNAYSRIVEKILGKYVFI